MLSQLCFRSRKNLDDLNKFVKDIEDFNKHNIDEEYPIKLIENIYNNFYPFLIRYYQNINYESLELKKMFPKNYVSPKEDNILFREFTKGSIGRAISHKRRIYIQEPKKEEANDQYVSIDDRIKNEIVIPILHNYFVKGIIIIDFDRRLKKQEITAFEIISNLIPKITKSQFENKARERRLSFIKNLPKSLQSGFDNVITEFFLLINELYPIKFINFWLYTSGEYDDNLVLRSFYPKKVNDRSVEIKDFDNTVLVVKNCTTGKVFDDLNPMKFDNLIHDRKFKNLRLLRKIGINSCYSFPIVFNNIKLGLLNYTPVSEEDMLSDSDIEDINSLVQMLDLIFNYYNLNDVDTFLKNYDQIFSNIFTLSDDKKSWDNLAYSICELMNCETCSIFHINENNRDQIKLKGSTGIVGNPPYDDVVYNRGEGVTGYVFDSKFDKDPSKGVIYYKVHNSRMHKIHVSKWRESGITSTQSKSIIFVPIADERNNTIGVIRCNNKIKTTDIHSDRFTIEDRNKLEYISNLISNILTKTEGIKDYTKEREKNIYSLHHEIKGPISGINLHAEWILLHTSRFSSQDWDLGKIKLKFEDIKQNSVLVNNLVETMGDLDNLTVKVSHYNPYQLIEVCKGDILNEAKINNIRISNSSLNIPGRMSGGVIHIMRLFYNLLRNSIKYHNPYNSERYIKISAKYDTDNEFAIFQIVDNGVGIPVGEEEKIFLKLERGSNANKWNPQGTGLGLTYCKQIVNYHGGYIRVINNINDTVIEFSLPKNFIQ